MKRVVLLLSIIFLLLNFAITQTPQGLNYQAIARNSSGQAYINQSISVKLEICNTSATGEIVYSEIQEASTNALGLFSLNIGNGTPVNNFVFSKIDWSKGGSKWLSVYIDIARGNNFVLMGTTQLLSVPYALYAEKSNQYTPPLMTELERNAITNPAQGMEIINTTTGCINYFQNYCWKEICGVCTKITTEATNNGPICEGSVLNLYATTIPNATYHWTGPNNFSSDLQNPTLLQATIAAAGEYTVVVTVGGSQSSANTTAVINSALRAGAYISTQSTTICPGSIVTFTATAINGGTAPTFQWKKNGTDIGGNYSTFTTEVLSNNDLITCVITSSLTSCITNNPATSNEIKMTVSQSLAVSVGVYLSGGTTTFCQGTTLLFSALPTNGGTNPQYQWLKNGNYIQGATTATYSAVDVIDQDAFSVILTSSEKCATNNPATSDAVKITIKPKVPVSIKITTESTKICSSPTAGTSVTITATATNGGTNPQFQWKKNNVVIQGATASIYTTTTIVDKDSICCLLYSSETCPQNYSATSNTLKFAVNTDIAVSLYIIPLNQITSVCAGESVTFTTYPVNGGSNPTFQWKKNGVALAGQTASTYTTSELISTDVFTCVMYSSLTGACVTNNPATSNERKITVNPKLSVGVDISTPKTTICQNTSAMFTAIALNGGTGPKYQWNKNKAIIVGATTSMYYSYDIADKDIITCTLTSSETCTTNNPASSNLITMTVIPQPTTSVAGFNQIDVIGTSATLAANTPVFGTGAWTINSGTGGIVKEPANPTSTFTGLAGTTYSLRWAISNDCGGSMSDVTISFKSTSAQGCGWVTSVTYENKTYNTIQIGTQCWFKENLNVGTLINAANNQTNNRLMEKFCYNDDEANCTTAGGLYQWDEMMQYVSTEKAKGICPTGWHIPSNSEWTTLELYVDPSGNTSGTKLKKGGTSGMEILLGGMHNTDGVFYQIDTYGYYWSSTISDTAKAWQMFFPYNTEKMQHSANYYGIGMSVRCIKD